MITATCYAFLCANAFAQAQDGSQSGEAASKPGKDATTLDRITVKGTRAAQPLDHATVGTKTDAKLIEIPQSISVVGQAQMTAQGVQDVAQALRYSAGVTPETQGEANLYDTIYSRGFALDEYRDGLRMPQVGNAIPQFEPYLLDRIEVLHGPASVLFGQANPGGVANLVSKRPTAIPIHEIGLQVGSYRWNQGMLDLGGPLDADGHFLYRIAGLARDTGGQVDHTGNRAVAIAPSMTWQPDENTHWTFLGSYQDEPRGKFYNFVPGQGSAFPNPNGKISTSLDTGDPSFDRYKRRQDALGWEFEHRFDDTWTVRQNLRVAQFEDAFDKLYANGLEDDLRTLDRYAFRDIESLRAVSLDNQVEARFDLGRWNHTVLAGLDYQRTTWNQQTGFAFGGVPTLDVFAPVYGQVVPVPEIDGNVRQTQDGTGLYVQDHIRVGQWSLLASAREDHLVSNLFDRFAQAGSSTSDRAFTWRAGAVYQTDAGFAPYVSYAESFTPTAGTDFFDKPFVPTTAQQYEVGLKYQPPASRWFTTLSAFDLTQQNVPTADPDPTHPFAQIQAGEVRSRGVELEAHATVLDHLELIGSYTSLNQVVTKSNDVDNLFGVNRGKKLQGIPSRQASLWLDYEPEHGLGGGAGARYTGSSFVDNLNTAKTSSYLLFDAVLHLRLEHWQLALNASNLLDKTYVASCGSGESYCYYGLRRNVLATARYQW